MNTAIPTLSTFEIIIVVMVMIVLAILSIWMVVRIFKDSKPISIVPAVFPHTIPPSQTDPEMPECSMNVIAIDEDGMMFIGFYAYENPTYNKLGWVFMHDKAKPQGDFVWMYKPENFKV